MRSALRFLLLCLALASGAAQAAGPLLTPAELQPLAAAGAVRLIDVREGPAYALQHLPGAVSAPYGRWRGPDTSPGQVPPLAELTALVQELGLTPDTHAVVVYTGIDATDFGNAARTYWTLKSLGMARLSILNGGLAAWRDAGLPVSSAPAAAPRSAWQPRFDPRWMATRDEVKAAIGQPGTLLIDARPPPYFQGRIAHDAARARGTLPGAVSVDSELFFELGSAALLDKASLAAEADALDAPPGAPVVAFCNTGHWSATDWFVLSEVLGRPGVRMYPGSMVEWTQSPAPLPMANEPGRWRQLRYMALGWAHRNLGTKAP
ncbi:rhodanese-like domain-containing protein [Ottowia sp.]|jgi:thiosulfate/3-mercaptopyruvate sulfurtransferase|uniref:sulfurtransferase n=1 Tax=Ottowia sp. TaxID=1898956 RepID=UPI0025D3E356|nr:rhodanese-like domain-containing protein [Ottowia sp.]